MIENQTQLAIAAHDFAVETLDMTDEFKLGQLRHTAFEKLGIDAKHFNIFGAEAASVRARYLGLRKHKLAEEEPKK